MTSDQVAIDGPDHGPAPIFEDYGLSAFTFHGPPCDDDGEWARRPVMSPHNHLEVELVLVESGVVTFEFSGVVEELEPFEPVLFWGGVPHRVLHVAPRSRFHVAQVPMVDVLSWANAAPMLRTLLDGTVLREPPDHEETAVECLVFARWARDISLGDRELRRAAELEIEARFRRFLIRACGSARSSGRGSASVPADRLATVTRFVAAHFREPITVDDVAAAVGWHRDHLMASFRRFCGITLWTYVTRLRLAEARRLLATTHLPMLQVCHRAGFGSTSQMYDVFNRYHEMTPASYRRAFGSA